MPRYITLSYSGTLNKLQDSISDFKAIKKPTVTDKNRYKRVCSVYDRVLSYTPSNDRIHVAVTDKKKVKKCQSKLK